MARIAVSARVWHPTFDVARIQTEIGRICTFAAEKGQRRGKADATFSETYCCFDIQNADIAAEADILDFALKSIGELDLHDKFIKTGGRVWVTLIVQEKIYELSLSRSEIKRLAEMQVDFSIDFSGAG